jgi:hypothetical protein
MRWRACSCSRLLSAGSCALRAILAMNVKDLSDGNGDQDRERRDEHE